MSELGSPPAYDDVVGSSQPSAPPPEAIGPPSLTQYHHDQREIIPPAPPSSQSAQPASQPSSSRRASAPQGQKDSSKLDKFVRFYTSYSIAHHLRKYIIPKGNRLDPELDVEAQFSRQVVRDAQARIAKGMRVQCISGWLWCLGVLQILLYILLPVGMLVTGGVGFSECPYNSDAIIIYLLLGGCVVAIFVFMRALPSLMTCFRNRNYLNSGKSSSFTACICLFEVIFYVVATANLVILILGTVWIFQNTSIPECSESEATAATANECCERYVYAASAFFNVFQYIMYAITAVYVCIVAGCVRNMDTVYNRRV